MKTVLVVPSATGWSMDELLGCTMQKNFRTTIKRNFTFIPLNDKETLGHGTSQAHMTKWGLKSD